MGLSWFDIIQQTFMVSGFVLFMMLIIEYINVRTKGKWSNPLKKSRWVQLFVAIILGLAPGCAGPFAIISLFTHNIINFSALLSGTIASMGDEAFIMISLIPSTYIKLIVSITVIAIIAGLLLNIFGKNKPKPLFENHLENHGDECCTTESETIDIKHVLQKFTFTRSMLLSVLVLIIFSQFASFGGAQTIEQENSIFSAESLVFIGLGLISMFIILTVPEHFLMDHLWGHVIKKHFIRLFLWSLGALIAIAILSNYLNFEEWIKVNQLYTLLIALVVGIIPVSGPHIIFITLFMSGAIPFSFLLANSVVQEGHAGIPLLAEDRKSFVKLKIIKIIIGLIIGLLGMYFSF